VVILEQDKYTQFERIITGCGDDKYLLYLDLGQPPAVHGGERILTSLKNGPKRLGRYKIVETIIIKISKLVFLNGFRFEILSTSSIPDQGRREGEDKG